jgi:hypothetical protein
MECVEGKAKGTHEPPFLSPLFPLDGGAFGIGQMDFAKEIGPAHLGQKARLEGCQVHYLGHQRAKTGPGS